MVELQEISWPDDKFSRSDPLVSHNALLSGVAGWTCSSNLSRSRLLGVSGVEAEPLGNAKGPPRREDKHACQLFPQQDRPQQAYRLNVAQVAFESLLESKGAKGKYLPRDLQGRDTCMFVGVDTRRVYRDFCPCFHEVLWIRFLQPLVLRLRWTIWYIHLQGCQGQPLPLLPRLAERLCLVDQGYAP
jgi:hypothetical protein